MNSPINRDPKRLEQCGKNFLTKLAPKVNNLGIMHFSREQRSLFPTKQNRCLRTNCSYPIHRAFGVVLYGDELSAQGAYKFRDRYWKKIIRRFCSPVQGYAPWVWAEARKRSTSPAFISICRTMPISLSHVRIPSGMG